MDRNKKIYGLLLIAVMLMGLASRRFFADMSFVRTYAGDALWALMVFFGFAFILNRWSVKTVALIAILFSFGIEVSQVYHASWIDELRATRLGGLILGFSFVWSDLLCYSVGVAVGVLIDIYLNGWLLARSAIHNGAQQLSRTKRKRLWTGGNVDSSH